MDPMPTPSSSGRRLAAALAVSIAAALTAASGPARAEGGDGKAAPTSGTCRICHTDPAFGAAFSHKGLVESGDGCFTCHAGPEAHVKARGGRGNVPVPAKMEASAEKELCLTCHEEYDAPKHLAPKGKDARCTSCHTLHGAPLPTRAGAEKTQAPPDATKTLPPAPGPFRFSGSVEAGWRFVGNEEGRYFQDLNLDDGPRLFALDVKGESGDPLGPRVEANLEGLGDPRERARLRARRGDDWKASVDARRDELPFLGQNGLHGGETLRENLSAAVDLRLSPSARLGLGYDRSDVEGEIQGTVFENGLVLPAAMSQDRTTQEGSATLDFRGKAWHAKIRQGWLTEDGSDGTRRNASTPTTPDSISYDDDSSMDGPVTFVAAGADALDGRLSLEARASRADLSREVDTTEARRADLAGPYSQDSTTTGSRDRIVDAQGLQAALSLGGTWALEAAFDRRALREDGTVSTRTTTTTTAGTTATATSSEDRVSQRTMEERVGVRRSLGKDFHVRGGAEWIQDRLDYSDASAGGEVRTQGFFAGADGALTPELRVHGEARSAHGTGVFTPLTPTDRDLVKLGAAWRDEQEGTRAGIDWGVSDLESEGRTAASHGWDFRVFGGLGKEGDATLDLGYTVRNLTLSVDTLAYVGSSLTPGESVSAVRSHVLDFGIAIPVTAKIRLTAGGTWALDQGTLPVRAFDATVGVRWQISAGFAARIELRRREYDEFGNDSLDYKADILEVAVEMMF